MPLIFHSMKTERSAHIALNVAVLHLNRLTATQPKPISLGSSPVYLHPADIVAADGLAWLSICVLCLPSALSTRFPRIYILPRRVNGTSHSTPVCRSRFSLVSTGFYRWFRCRQSSATSTPPEPFMSRAVVHQINRLYKPTSFRLQWRI